MIQKLAAAIKERGDKSLAMCLENSENSDEGEGVCGEQDGLRCALALTPAATFADWYAKEAVLRHLCVRDGEGHNALFLTDKIPAMLAASLLDDIAALLKHEVAIAA
jgi:hypothetical protein